MRFDEACSLVFARHETFHPRYGWAKKAIDAVDRGGLATDVRWDSDLFGDEEKAVVALGVGKNMVKSIRFWGLAYKLLAAQKIPGRRNPVTLPTRMGSFLFARDGGVDQYAEDVGTGWLLHWRLLAPPCSVPVWWLVFNELRSIEFDETELEQLLDERVRDSDASPSALNKDLLCMLRMYVGGEKARTSFDDQIDCPSRELGLLGGGASPGTWRFQIGPKPTLSPLILLHCCLDYLARIDASSRTVTLSRLQLDSGSPGAAFKLDDETFLELVGLAIEGLDGISLSTTAGVPQLVLDAPAAELGTKALRNHFKCELETQPLRWICGPDGDRVDADDFLDQPA